MAWVAAVAAVLKMSTAAFVFSTLTLVGSIAYQIREARKMRKARKAADEARKGFEFVVEGSAVDIPIVYGYAKVGGVRVFHGVTSNFEYADSEANKVFDVGIDEGAPQTLTLKHYDDLTGQWHETIETVATHESSKLNRRIEGSKNEFLLFQQALCQGPINACHEVIVDDGRYLDDPTMGRADYKKDRFNKIRAAFRADVFFGEGAQNDPLMSANFGERHSAKFTDIAYASVYIRLDRDEPQFSGGVPDVQFLIEGKKVRKVAGGILQSTRVFSNNPVWCLLDYLLSQPDLTVESCFGLSLNRIDLVSFEQAAAICDQIVMTDVPVGGRFWQPVDGVRNIVKRDLPLYECNIIIDPANSFRENVTKILDTMGNAHLRWSQGKYRLFLLYPPNNESIPNMLYLGDDDLVAGEAVIAQPSMSEKLNNCTVRFHDANMEFRENSVSWPPKKNTTNFRGIGGFRYPPAPTTEWSQELTKIMPMYAVWSGSHGTTTLAWKFVSYVEGTYELNFAASDTATITISGPGVSLTDSVAGNTILKRTVVGQALSVYTVTITATAGKEDRGVAAFLRHTALNTQVWSTREPAYTDFEVKVRTDAVYQTMRAADNGVELETEIFYDGCTDYYHAMAKAEELVRTSRSSAGVSFSFIIKDKVPEPGDFISVSSQDLSIGLGNQFIIRANEVNIGENGVCAIKGARFDWTQLAWNVPDDEYYGAPPIYDFRVLPPFNVRYEPDVDAIYSESSGKVTWEHPDPASIQRYYVYILSNEDITNGIAHWRELGTSINFDYQLPLLNPTRTYIFGVRALGLNGVLSAMATSGVMGHDIFNPGELPVDVPLTLSVWGIVSGIRIDVTLDDGSELLGRHLQFLKGTSNDRAAAQDLAEVTGRSYLDTDVEHEVTYYYWVRLVNHHRSGDEFGEWFGPESAMRLVDGDWSVPPAPLYFEGESFFDRVVVWWRPVTPLNYPGYNNHAYARILRSDVNDLSTAVPVGISPGDSFTDFPGENRTVYYWVQFVSTMGVSGPINSPNGLMLTTGRLIEKIIDELEGQVRESHLHTELWTPISEALQVSEVITELGAQWTVKTNVNGLVAGFGLYNDGITSSFGVLADKFWIGGANHQGTLEPNENNIPFIVRTNSGAWGPPGVYMRSAFIQNASIDHAKIIKADIWDLVLYNEIRSVNYVPNSSGFRLSRDGVFELSQGNIRQSVIIGQRTVGSLNNDITAANNAADTALTSANTALTSASRIDSFRYPHSPVGQTWIDGTKIAADVAFVGTLFIQNWAVNGMATGWATNVWAASNGWSQIVAVNYTKITSNPLVAMIMVICTPNHEYGAGVAIQDNHGQTYFQAPMRSVGQTTFTFVVPLYSPAGNRTYRLLANGFPDGMLVSTGSMILQEAKR